jgi:hypothetical protein
MGKSGRAVPSSDLTIVFIHCNLKTCDRYDMTLSKRLIFAEKLDRIGITSTRVDIEVEASTRPQILV